MLHPFAAMFSGSHVHCCRPEQCSQQQSPAAVPQQKATEPEQQVAAEAIAGAAAGGGSDELELELQLSGEANGGEEQTAAAEEKPRHRSK